MWLAAIALSLAAWLPPAGEAVAQAEGALVSSRACRADYRQFCRGIRPGGGAVATCLRAHASEVAPSCASALALFRAERRRGGPASEVSALPEGVRIERDLAYGALPQQRLDLYQPAKPTVNAPIIVMLHGGAWALGSKSAAQVVDNKVTHWLPKGALFVSIETRLLPQADPLAQAGDAALALGFVQKNAAGWGGDPRKIVLMGHSSGAHVAMLVTTDGDLARKAKLEPWLATVALDSAALDVEAIMRGEHARLYGRAFGRDPTRWRKASPAAQLRDGKSLPPILLVCSSLRQTSCPQARAFAAKAGSRVSTLAVALRHEAINADLGRPGVYTTDVDAFLHRQGLR
ncbi:alpha/beta hydrolase fold domain-containing protein [Neorhizobium sp. NPDC001467]|uniref:alpha/beta hydrolase fold domain-containing protein n=1 Tax=Neorhizobium sp. NPDC001467 TaxID=3390595 RepID=UPI003D05B8D9